MTKPRRKRANDNPEAKKEPPMLFDMIAILNDERDRLMEMTDQTIAELKSDISALDLQMEALIQQKGILQRRIETIKAEAEARHSSLGVQVEAITNIIGGPRLVAKVEAAAQTSTPEAA